MTHEPGLSRRRYPHWKRWPHSSLFFLCRKRLWPCASCVSRGSLMEMLDVALTFLVKNVNSYLAAKSVIGTVQASRVVDDQGKWVIAEDSLGASVLYIV